MYPGRFDSRVPPDLSIGVVCRGEYVRKAHQPANTQEELRGTLFVIIGKERLREPVLEDPTLAERHG